MSFKWLRPFFDLPTQPAKSLFFVKFSKCSNLVNFYPIWFKLGMEVIYKPQSGECPFEVAATIFRPTSPTNKNRPKVKIFNFRVFHPIWMKFGMGTNNGSKIT